MNIKEIFAGVILSIGVLIILFGFMAISVAYPTIWKSSEEKQCNEMGGLFLQHSFSSDCVFKPK